MARYILFMKPGITSTEYSDGPTAEAAEQMGRFNQELQDAGVLLALDGLAPTEEGARVAYSGGTPTVTDGPFADSRELIGGYWIIQAADKAEAVAWASRVPAVQGDEFEIEVRRIYDMEDFAPKVVEATTLADGEPPAQPTER